MTIIAVGDYRPDVPAYLSTHATVADGVYPKPDGSDGPLRAGVTTSATLSSAPKSRPCAAVGARLIETLTMSLIESPSAGIV